MQTIPTNFYNMLISPSRQIGARVELYEGSTLASTFNHTDYLKDFKIERVGEHGKFFGFGVTQKLTVNILDKDRVFSITKTNYLQTKFAVNITYINLFPNFYIDDVKRDENTNQLTVTAYDALYKAKDHTVADLELGESYTIKEFAEACAALLGVTLVEPTDASFNTSYSGGANFEGTETLKEALNAIAEATQTVYYMGRYNELTFKRLDAAGAPVFTVDKSKYFTLNSKDSYTLSTIVHTTELGDNVSASAGEGATQYVRNNPFWDLREDIDTLVNNAVTAVGGLTINQFTCSWRGNFFLEIGDKINLVTKDDDTVTSYVLDDIITYNGGLAQTTQWSYKEETETASNPSSLGEVIKQTYARVDKANKQIDIVASEVGANTTAIANLQVKTDGITAAVEDVQKSLNDTNKDIIELNRKAELAITPEDVTIAIKSEMQNGVDRVTTNTGFTFNDEGLTVSKTGTEMTTTITEDGMTVKKNNEAVLTANNTGVDAVNLRATTYLIIGKNSRFEDYGNRTGCFWIGGND